MSEDKQEVLNRTDIKLKYYSILSTMLMDQLQSDFTTTFWLSREDYEDMEQALKEVEDKDNRKVLQVGGEALTDKYIYYKGVSDVYPQEMNVKNYVLAFKLANTDKVEIEVSLNLLFSLINYTDEDYFVDNPTVENVTAQEDMENTLHRAYESYSNQTNIGILLLKNLQETRKKGLTDFNVGVSKFVEVRSFIIDGKTYPILGGTLENIMPLFISDNIRIYNYQKEQYEELTKDDLDNFNELVNNYVTMNENEYCSFVKIQMLSEVD